MIHWVYAEERGEREQLQGLKSALEAANSIIPQKSLEQEELKPAGVG